MKRTRIPLLLAFSGLSVASAAPATRYAQVDFPDRTHVRAEVAATEAEREQGLMFRTSMAELDGMIFVFDAPGMHAFWMKNTLIPLDMLFVDQQGRIINIHERAVPGSLDPIAAAGPARAVIELNGGTAGHLGIKPGDRVIYPIFGNAS
jgi:uncharacterized protein